MSEAEDQGGYAGTYMLSVFHNVCCVSVLVTCRGDLYDVLDEMGAKYAKHYPISVEERETLDRLDELNTIREILYYADLRLMWRLSRRYPERYERAVAAWRLSGSAAAVQLAWRTE